MRRTDILQLYLVGFGLVFVLWVSATAWAQVPPSQEAINATLFERLNGIVFRIERVENFLAAAIVALIANFVAHLVQIRNQSARRRGD